jgi:hypothetical protein
MLVLLFEHLDGLARVQVGGDRDLVGRERRERGRGHLQIAHARLERAVCVGLVALDVEALLVDQEAIVVDGELARACVEVAGDAVHRAGDDEEAVTVQRDVRRDTGVGDRALCEELLDVPYAHARAGQCR